MLTNRFNRELVLKVQRLASKRGISVSALGRELLEAAILA
ncbi:hypothetical protein UFOVP813_11 [uncultured Caudovirales phage]|uniref:Uncharacterized protein n=1 Tax=uncultured Caudovirales phage TaxID=2100421 RepID=A0A6J5P1R3_9CAUD|nr:hypothetical protein UFOVP813_11 [uncultured Caudovirales phage]